MIIFRPLSPIWTVLSFAPAQLPLCLDQLRGNGYEQTLDNTALLLPAATIGLAVLVPILPNPIHALLSLLGLFGAATIFFLIHGAEYLAFVFLIVYVGAIAILFLFVIMLLDAQEIMTNQKKVQLEPLQLTTAMIGPFLIFRFLSSLQREFETTCRWTDLPTPLPTTEIHLLAAGLFGEHWPLFFLISLILLLAMLGAIILAISNSEKESGS